MVLAAWEGCWQYQRGTRALTGFEKGYLEGMGLEDGVGCWAACMQAARGGLSFCPLATNGIRGKARVGFSFSFLSGSKSVFFPPLITSAAC